MSDKVIIQQLDFLKCIDPGDVVLNDHRFDIHNDPAVRGVKLEKLAFIMFLVFCNTILLLPMIIARVSLLRLAH